MTAGELFKAGKLVAALNAALEAVKKRPTDTSARGFLAELLCFTGDFERADKQLDTILQQEPDLAVGLAMLRQVLRAEIARQQFYGEGRVPELVAEASPAVRLQLEASIAIREGRLGEAAEILDRAEEARVHPHGTCDGRPFDDFRDLDDPTAGVLEVLGGNGNYYWVPLDSVERIEFRAPERARDLIWRRALVTVHDGPDGEVYLPVLYPGTHKAEKEDLQLGRSTDWTGGDGVPVRGVGQRMFLVGEEAQAIMQLGCIEFAR